MTDIWYMYLGFAEICRGRLEAAIEQLKHAIDSGYPTYITYSTLAGAEPRRGTTPRRNLPWQRRVASFLDSQSNGF